MKNIRPRLWLAFGLIVAGSLVFATRTHAVLTTNSWTDGSGKWEMNGNWSAGIPTSANAVTLITNGGNNTVTIDAATTNFFSTMTISNLLVSAPVNSTNTLFLNNAGFIVPLRIFNGFTLSSGGALLVKNSVLRVEAVSGGIFHIDGAVTTRAGAQLDVTSTATFLGSAGRGSLTLSGGVYQAREMHLAGC